MVRKLSNDELVRQAAINVQLVEFAYKYNIDNLDEAFDQLPYGVELMMVTDFVDDTQKHEYRCAVFRDTNSNQIIMANAGTRMDKVDDLLADLKLAVKRVPKKAKSAEVANQMILDSLGAAVEKYRLHYTGHSLGAAMAEIAASDMAIKLRKNGKVIQDNQISTISFDNPGTKGIAERIYTQNGYLAQQCEHDIEFNVFNTTPNLVNTVNAQVGRVHLILPDNARKVGAFLQAVRSTLAVISKALEFIVTPATYVLDKIAEGKGVVAYIASVIKEVILVPSKIVKVLSLGEIVAQVKSHSTSNFINVFNKGQGTLKLTGSDGKEHEVTREEIARHAVKTVREQLDSEGRHNTTSYEIVTASRQMTRLKSQEVEGRSNNIEIYSTELVDVARTYIGKLDTTPSTDEVSEIIPIISKKQRVKEEVAEYKANHPGVSGKKARQSVKRQHHEKQSQQLVKQEQEQKQKQAAEREKEVAAYMKMHPDMKRQDAKKAVHWKNLKKNKHVKRSLKEHAATKDQSLSRG